MQKVTVNTNTTNYPIYVEEGLFSNEKFLAAELEAKLVGSRVCTVSYTHLTLPTKRIE